MKTEWETELLAAESARQAGNEGRARVCARRAAGMAAMAYLLKRDGSRPGNVYQALLELVNIPGLAVELKTAATHLTMQVTEKFTLPVEADLIEDARLLCRQLLKLHGLG